MVCKGIGSTERDLDRVFLYGAHVVSCSTPLDGEERGCRTEDLGLRAALLAGGGIGEDRLCALSRKIDDSAGGLIVFCRGCESPDRTANERDEGSVLLVSLLGNPERKAGLE